MAFLVLIAGSTALGAITGFALDNGRRYHPLFSLPTTTMSGYLHWVWLGLMLTNVSDNAYNFCGGCSAVAYTVAGIGVYYWLGSGGGKWKKWFKSKGRALRQLLEKVRETLAPPIGMPQPIPLKQ